jgi:hypothetical protein
MLWKNLQIYYPDPSTFVPGIAQVIIMWCNAMIAWLESDDNEEQVDKMLDGLKARGRLDIAIEVTFLRLCHRANSEVLTRNPDFQIIQSPNNGMVP